MRFFAAVFLVLASLSASAQVSPLIVLGGQEVSFGGFYWIRDCQPIHKSMSLTVVSGSPHVQLNLKHQVSIKPRQKECTQNITGAQIILRAKQVEKEENFKLVWVITYDTTAGTQNSRHERVVQLLPGKGDANQKNEPAHANKDIGQNVYSASTVVPIQSCSTENAACLHFCRTQRPTEGCFGDCSGRQADCLQTGTYRWNNRPHVTGLQKK
jgi:hypothetical protein